MLRSAFDKIMDFDPIVVVAAAVASIGLLILAARKQRQRNGALYPPYAPGTTLETMKIASGGEGVWWYLQVAKELKTRVFQLSLPSLAPMVVVVGEVETFRKILTDPLSTKPSIYKSIRKILGGAPTMFTSSGGNIWHSKRKSCAPAFSSNHIKRMNKIAMEKTNKWIDEELRPMIEAGTSFNVGEEMIKITLDVISETAFEYKMSPEEKSMYVSELELGLIEFAMKEPSNPLRHLFGMFLPERRRAFVAAEKLHKLGMKILDSYRKLETPTKGTIMDQIMTSTAFETDKDRVGQILEFLLAGHDTTGYSISWILLELARNPEEQKRLRASLSSMSPEEWSKSDVLKMVVKEGMRLHPVAANGSIRVIGKDMMTSKKELLPKGSEVIIPFLLLFRDPDVFENANSFCPTRWENPSKTMTEAFNPFSLGKQNCIGQSLARAEMHYVVARICSEFNLVVEEEGSVDFFLTLKPIGVKLRAENA